MADFFTPDCVLLCGVSHLSYSLFSSVFYSSFLCGWGFMSYFCVLMSFLLISCMSSDVHDFMCISPDITRRYSFRANSSPSGSLQSFYLLFGNVQKYSVNVSILVGLHHSLFWLVLVYCNVLCLWQISFLAEEWRDYCGYEDKCLSIVLGDYAASVKLWVHIILQ